MREQLDVEADRQPLAVDEDPVAVEDDEVEPAGHAGAPAPTGSDGSVAGGRGTPGSGTHSPSDRTSAMPGRDRRVERLGRRDRGLDRGQAEDPLRGRGEPDLRGVADGAGAWRRGVDHEAYLAVGDRLEDPDLADRQVRLGAELRDRDHARSPASRRSVRVPGVAASR